MPLCDSSKYNCGLIVPSSCIPYTGSDLTILSNPSILPCNANINDVIFILDSNLKTIIDGNNLTNLNNRCLDFSPATIKINELHQIEIDKICALDASLTALQDSFDTLNIGSELIQIDLQCLTPSAAACLTPPDTYTLQAVLNVIISEICALKTAVGI